MAFLFKLMIGCEPFFPPSLSFPHDCNGESGMRSGPWAPIVLMRIEPLPQTVRDMIYFVCIHLMSHRQLSADPFSIECFH